MSQKFIRFTIEQDGSKVPEKIYWEATDNPNEGLEETKAIMVGVWDQYNHGTMFLPLWNKEMDVFDMKRFCIEIIGCLADVVQTATGDTEMSSQIDRLGMDLSQKVRQQMQEAVRK
jgi:gliding motility-associated protein GldC